MRLDRSAIFKDAHKRYRDAKRIGLGQDFAQCLRTAWTAAKIRAVCPRQRYQPETLPREVIGWWA